MRQDWTYFKCDGCGKLFKFCKSSPDLNNYLLNCYSINDKSNIDENDLEFCSDNCCLKYVTSKITNHLNTNMTISNFILWVNKEASDITTDKNNSQDTESSTLSKWIDYKDRLPEINRPVFTYDGHCFAVERRIAFIDTEDGQIEGEWWIDGYEGDEFDPIGLRDGAIIKWKPLPELNDVKEN